MPGRLPQRKLTLSALMVFFSSPISKWPFRIAVFVKNRDAALQGKSAIWPIAPLK